MMTDEGRLAAAATVAAPCSLSTVTVTDADDKTEIAAGRMEADTSRSY